LYSIGIFIAYPKEGPSLWGYKYNIADITPLKSSFSGLKMSLRLRRGLVLHHFVDRKEQTPTSLRVS